MSSIVDAALDYARRGWKVLPLYGIVDGRCACGGRTKNCKPGKHPLTPHGVKDASADVEQVAAWWKRWPTANVGLATGEEFDVLDIDADKGGFASLAELVKHHGDLPPTWTADTGGGGLHLCFVPSQAIRNLSDHRPGIDTRGARGYIVAAPSLHISGHCYRWRHPPDALELATMPGWLLKVVTEGHKEPSRPGFRGLITGLRKAENGQRNTQLNKAAFRAGGLVRAGEVSREEAEAALTEAGEAIGLAAAEVNATVASGLKAGEAKTPARKACSQADELVRLALEAGEVWRSPGGVDAEGFVSLNAADGIRRNMPIRSRAFRHWLSGRYYRDLFKAPGSQPVADALVTLAGIALHEGCEYPAPVRVHGSSSEVWLDLGAPDWQVVHIDATGWRIRPGAEGPHFIRPKGLQPLPAPVPGGDWQELRTLLNLDGDGEHWPLVVAWLAGCMMPQGPYPLLILEGEQGAGKSTAARMLKGLVDANSSPLRRPPRDERDLMIAASNAWVVAYDNVSGLPPYLCDALCTVATGGGFSTRQLYSDADEQLFDAQRPVLLNGIDAPSTRPDLLDRAVRVVLPAIPEDARRTEAELLGAFNAARPKLLGLLCTATQTAFRRRGEVQLDRLPRMADWASWVVACEPALDLDQGSFLAAFHENRLASVNVALEASAVGGYLIRLADADGFTGSAAELLAWLIGEASDADRHRRDWPTSPALLSKAIRRISPELRRLGIDVTFAKERAGRLLTITRAPF